MFADGVSDLLQQLLHVKAQRRHLHSLKILIAEHALQSMSHPLKVKGRMVRPESAQRLGACVSMARGQKGDTVISNGFEEGGEFSVVDPRT